MTMHARMSIGIVLGSLVVVAGSLFCYDYLFAQSKDVSAGATIRARRIEIVDANGNVQVVISAGVNGAAGLYVPDDKTPRAAFGMRPNGWPMLTVFGKDNRLEAPCLASLFVREDANGSSPALTLSASRGEVILATGSAGNTSAPVGVVTELKDKSASAGMMCFPNSHLAGVHVTDGQGNSHGIATDGDVLNPR